MVGATPGTCPIRVRDLGQVEYYARFLAELHGQLHNRVAPELPSQRERLLDRIARAQPLAEDTRRALIELLHGLPDGDRLCHGDFHPGNIIMAERGPVIIDWVDAARGSAAADVARTWVLLMGHAAYPDTPSWVRPLARECCSVHLQRYLELGSTTEAEVTAWLPIIAAARLRENIPEAREWLLSVVER